jgi:hypothetical protein
MLASLRLSLESTVQTCHCKDWVRTIFRPDRGEIPGPDPQIAGWSGVDLIAGNDMDARPLLQLKAGVSMSHDPTEKPTPDLHDILRRIEKLEATVDAVFDEERAMLVTILLRLDALVADIRQNGLGQKQPTLGMI